MVVVKVPEEYTTVKELVMDEYLESNAGHTITGEEVTVMRL